MACFLSMLAETNDVSRHCGTRGCLQVPFLFPRSDKRWHLQLCISPAKTSAWSSDKSACTLHLHFRQFAAWLVGIFRSQMIRCSVVCQNPWRNYGWRIYFRFNMTENLSDNASCPWLWELTLFLSSDSRTRSNQCSWHFPTQGKTRELSMCSFVFPPCRQDSTLLVRWYVQHEVDIPVVRQSAVGQSVSPSKAQNLCLLDQTCSSLRTWW